jgi:hypothetical protein
VPLRLTPSKLSAGPPPFLGNQVGARIDDLADSPIFDVIERDTRLEETAELLVTDQDHQALEVVQRVFHIDPDTKIRDFVTWITFRYRRERYWKMLWVKTLPDGMSEWTTEKAIRTAVGETVIQQLAKSAGLKVSVPIHALKLEVGGKWQKYLGQRVDLSTTESQMERFTFRIPRGGMDIALWELTDVLSRALLLTDPGRAKLGVARFAHPDGVLHSNERIEVPVRQEFKTRVRGQR